ncbi:hypothetical protein Nepgr_012739 [Nepenthes gracilis]|uniref:DNA repair RAD52-like protein 2, chloroplastic n=1 Tax=Nepenthes gracilis TaxID=150966 RepID=A0AAD3SGI6_NEPGR|nr:hypothetical protein Nepgr_012739 [Nepenthes gracilis]
MSIRSTFFLTKPITTATEDRFEVNSPPSSLYIPKKVRGAQRWYSSLRVSALDQKSAASGSGGSGGSDPKKAVLNSNYVVPLDNSASCITRPLTEILRDLNKRIPDNIVKPESKVIPWYHANRMLSFYAPGWCGEVRDAIFSENGSVTVVYRVTIRGSDGEAFRESTGTASSADPQHIADPVAAAEEVAFVRACARFGLGLYLYHDE